MLRLSKVVAAEDMKIVVAAAGINIPVVAAAGRNIPVVAAAGRNIPVVAAAGINIPVVAAAGSTGAASEERRIQDRFCWGRSVSLGNALFKGGGGGCGVGSPRRPNHTWANHTNTFTTRLHTSSFFMAGCMGFRASALRKTQFK